MIDVASLSAPLQAVVLIGTVLVEAIVLYVAYGALTTAFGPSVRDAIVGG